jgi:hypothetical protein
MVGPLAQLFIDYAREVARSVQKDRPRKERFRAPIRSGGTKSR